MKNWPAHSIEIRPLAALTPFKGNARTHSAEQVAQIAASIREWGWTQPILVDEDGGVIAGHGRLLAAKSLGIDGVPVVVARGWTAAQRRAYVLADNKLTENGGWDQDLLKVEFGALGDLGFDLNLIGFDASEIAGILAHGAGGLTDPDEVPAEIPVPGAQTGDVWLLGPHRLVCGDCTDPAVVEACVGQEKPHLMVTDPPYGVSYDATWRGKAGHANLGRNRVGKVAHDGQIDWRAAWALFPGDVAYVWHAGRHASAVQSSLESHGFEVRSQIIWAKTVMAMSRGDYHWQHEPCWYAVRKSKASQWQGDRKQTTLWQIASPLHIMSGSKEEKTAHPTQKPAECMKRPIENNSEPGSFVYDPFAGSGTTIIAGEMAGRHCFAVEIDPVYADMAIRRWQDFTGKTAMIESTGETLADRSKAAA